MKKSLFFKLLCVFSFVFGLFYVSTGLSDYIIDKTTYDENGTLPNKATSVNDNGEKVTITLKYQTIESKSAPDFAECFDENNKSFGTESKKINVGSSVNTNSTEYNRLKDFLTAHVKDNPFTNESLTALTYRLFGRDGDSKYEKIEFELHVTKEIKHSRKFLIGDCYSGEYFMLARDYTKTVYKVTDLSNTSQLSMRKNTSIDYSYLRNNLNNPDSTKYEFCGLKEVSSDGSITDNYFDMSNPITSNITLCAVFQNKNELSLNLSEITTTINNAASTIEFFKGAPSGRDISQDPGYNEKENIVYLGTSSLKTTVKAGATIKFDMNNGKEHVSMDVDSNGMSFEPEDGKHERQYTVALANDLIVNGALTIGGHFGNLVNYGRQGHIMNEYVCLDLNGHDIYVNSGGSLWSYGLIKDSVGTGHIYVNGAGTIYTLVAVMDYRGGTFTKSCKDNKVFPFIYYVLPYIRTKVIFNYKDGWGGLNAIFHLTAASIKVDYVHTESTLKFIGTGTDCLFRPEGGMNKSSRIIFDGYQQDGISSDMCIGRRVGLTVENTKLIMGAFIFDIDAGIGAIGRININTTEYNFPVNAFFDVRLVSSTLVFSQRIQFMAGMSFIADKDSTVIFTTNGDYSAQLSILDKGANYYDNKRERLITTDNSGDSYDYEGNIQNNENFWKYYSQPKIKIYGKLLFTKGNTSSKKYKLVGPCDFNEDNIGTIDGSNNITMYDKTKYSDPFTFLNQNGVSIQTYGFDYQISYDAYHVRGFSRPLVSNGKAYAVDDKDVKIGTYSSNDGIFRMDNGNCYYFNNDNKFTLGDTAGNTMKQCTVTENIIVDNETKSKYIYFASMYGQYDSAASTVNLSRISNNATAVRVSYSRNAERWLRS